MLEAWFTLMAEAMRGTQEAQEAFRALSEISANPEELSRWMARFMPAAVASTANLQPETFEAQLEEWWRIMGVVPRSRYLEVLERCDTLQRRLDRAEETIRDLRARLAGQERQEAEAQKALDVWNTMMAETLKSQVEWMKAWTASRGQSGSGIDDEEDTTADKADDSSQ